ncbi:MAG TPA: VOC family protein [Candidatus Bathyarchaeia archaeon]|nr:VOC family protein [Candidatus Bathyarchaeia archaeon]
MQLKRIGHVLLRVRDLDRSRRFYTAVLGFEVMEQDPEHGGLFMALPGHAHTLDLFPVADPAAARPPMAGGLGVQHVAFQVESEAALRDAYFSLAESGVTIVRAVDHVSQKSIYFHDPDGNLLEIYHELPNAREMFQQGRSDRDTPLVFEAAQRGEPERAREG